MIRAPASRELARRLLDALGASTPTLVDLMASLIVTSVAIDEREQMIEQLKQQQQGETS